MITKLDLFYVKSLLTKAANGKDQRKAKAATVILNDSRLLFEYTRVFIEKRDKNVGKKQKVSA